MGASPPDEANTCFGTCDYAVDMCAERKSVGPVAKFLTSREKCFFSSRAVHCIRGHTAKRIHLGAVIMCRFALLYAGTFCLLTYS